MGVESVGITQDSALQLAHSTALVQLSDGRHLTVHVPREFTVAPGKVVTVKEVHTTDGSTINVLASKQDAQ